MTYAIAVGAVERGVHYLRQVPDMAGSCWRSLA